MSNLKIAADQFVDIIDEATDGVLDGYIGAGSRIGVVSFASSATLDQSLTTNVNDIKIAINNLVASGGTRHAPAFQEAQTELTGSNPESKKVLIMFTNGQGSDNTAAANAAANARASGIEIFRIGLGSANEQNLKEWASNPDDEHVFIAPSYTDLEEIFQHIGTVISEPAATNIVIEDIVNSDFLVSNITVSKGDSLLNGNIINWEIDSLGAIEPETITLGYTITHNPTRGGGIKNVNDAVNYSDFQGNELIFPIPTVNVLCPVDLGITKTDEPDPIYIENPLTYTLTVTNYGPYNATGVTVVNTLPATVTYVSSIASQGTCSEAGGVVTCNLGNLTNGASAAITIIVTPTIPGVITNTATVSGNEDDPDPDN